MRIEIGNFVDLWTLVTRLVLQCIILYKQTEQYAFLTLVPLLLFFSFSKTG
jgi:tryptophan-rich sensory protein